MAQVRESPRQDGCGVGRNESEPPTPHRVDPHRKRPPGRSLGGRSIRPPEEDDGDAAGAETGGVDWSGAVVGLGVAAGEHAAMAPMRATARTICLIMGNLGCMAEPDAGLSGRWPGGHAKYRTDGPPTEAPGAGRGFLAGVSQGTGTGGGHA